MCTFQKDGVKFNSGKVISYLEAIENIRPEDVAELSANDTNGWSMFLLHRSMAEIKVEVSKRLTSPANVDEIKKIVRDEISKQPKILWTKTKKIAATIIGIVLGITTIINLISTIKNF